jgi:hypothetical protein
MIADSRGSTDRIVVRLGRLAILDPSNGLVLALTPFNSGIAGASEPQSAYFNFIQMNIRVYRRSSAVCLRQPCPVGVFGVVA